MTRGAVIFGVLLIAGSASADDRVRFNEQIRPLLSDRCIACHGPDAKRREADLRLDIRSGAMFKQRGVQVAAGVPLMCGEGDDFSTFRLGLFGLDKLTDVDGTVERLQARLGH